MLWLVEMLYYALQSVGLWNRLLATHKEKESANAQGALNRMDDADVDRVLRADFTKPPS